MILEVNTIISLTNVHCGRSENDVRRPPMGDERDTGGANAAHTTNGAYASYRQEVLSQAKLHSIAVLRVAALHRCDETSKETQSAYLVQLLNRAERADDALRAESDEAGANAHGGVMQHTLGHVKARSSRRDRESA